MKGSILIGYEINKEKKYTVHLKERALIGAHDTTFVKKSEFIYTAYSNIEGFFIRQ